MKIKDVQNIIRSKYQDGYNTIKKKIPWFKCWSRFSDNPKMVPNDSPQVD